jgi:hypothetical protein
LKKAWGKSQIGLMYKIESTASGITEQAKAKWVLVLVKAKDVIQSVLPGATRKAYIKKAKANYAFKPTADSALRSNQFPRRGGLMRR